MLALQVIRCVFPDGRDEAGAHSCALGFPADIDWGSALLVVQYAAISRTYVSIYICIERYDVHFYSYQL